ncbi:hypothetical protein HGA13_01545 [Nocardia speluncae]|uniref:Phage tail lysozyme domain-containing protein n=1 Tax=Nocardia speluncae TaxID=419477 RepID=A0A846X6K9_9NOCA|nr:phage tail tip lysozyme [Nocardia speluncae]NKY31761.1 hypothetical protein [Nocardia speluncae]
MARTEEWTLHRPVNAAILNPYVDYIESVLKALEDGLGDKNAQTLTPAELVQEQPERIGDSALQEQYGLNTEQIQSYQNDWYALDDQIGFIASFAAADANTVSQEFEDLRDAAVEISAEVPDDPTPIRQIDAVNALDNAVGVAYEAVLRAYAKLEGKSTDVPAQDWSSNGGAAPYVPGVTDTGSAYSNDSPQPIGEGEKARVEEIYQYLLEKGFTPAQAAGILGNLQVESGFDTGAYNPGEGAIGLAQWLGGRRENLEAFAAKRGADVTDWRTQIDFMVHELEGSESGAMRRLKDTTSAGQAAAVFDEYYERSSGEARGQRIANAESIASSMAGSGRSTDSSVLA